MVSRPTWLSISAAALLGSIAVTAPAAAGYRDAGWGGRTIIREVIVTRPVIRPPVVYETVVVRRPRVVHRVVTWPAYSHRVRYGWRHRSPWYDRPTCRLPERYLCR